MKEWLRAGTIIGTYQILMRVGVSGIGEVYRARDEYQNIDGALKLLPSSLMWTEESANRFVEILKTSPTLDHPNISKVLDAGIDQEGRPYAVTEYVRGQSLDEIGIGLARTMAEKIFIAIQVAEALDWAHQQGVLHLALKPSNIMLTSGGGVKVLDFVVSLATQIALMSRGPSAPKIKPTIGSSRYLSPEQVRGSKPSRQSDVFSLGVVCYELFAGQLPFSGRSAEEVTVAIVRDQPMPLTAYVPDADEDLNTILAKALEKDPAFRYQTAGEMAADLKALTEKKLEYQVVPTEEALQFDLVKNFKKSLWDFIARYLTRILAGVLFLLIAVGSGFVYLYFLREDRNFRLPTEVTPSTKVTSSGRVTELAISPGGNALAYVTEHGGKRTLLFKDSLDPRETVLALSNDVEITGVTFSIDGEWVYYVKNVAPAGELYVCSLRGGVSRRVLSNIASPVTFAPSGKEFAFVRVNGAESQIVIASARTEAPQRPKFTAAVPLPANTKAAGAVAAQAGKPPLGSAVPSAAATLKPALPPPDPSAAKGVVRPNASPTPVKFVVATDIPLEAQRVLLTRSAPLFILPQSLSWSHDGTTLAALVKKPANDLMPEIVGFNAQTGEEKLLCLAPGPEVSRVAWLSGDGALLINARALANSQWQLWKVRLPDGKARALTEEHEDFRNLSVSFDGQKALSIKTSRSVSVWLGANDQGKELTNNNDDGISGLAWFDANRLVHVSRASGADALWLTATDGQPPQYISWARFGSVDAQLFPHILSGKNMAYFSGVNDGQVAVYRADLSRLPKTVKAEKLTQGGADFFPQLAPDGAALYYAAYQNGRASLMRADSSGNTATPLLDGKVWRFALAPDGKQIAANYFDEVAGKWKIIVFPATGGQATHLFEAPGDAWRALGWMPDGSAIVYIITQNGVSNLWQQPLNGGAATQLTSFTRHRLYDFAWSPDSKQLAVVRGRSNDDAMILDSLK
jgi:serine/threonine protein kinase